MLMANDAKKEKKSFDGCQEHSFVYITGSFAFETAFVSADVYRCVIPHLQMLNSVLWSVDILPMRNISRPIPYEG